MKKDTVARIIGKYGKRKCIIMAVNDDGTYDVRTMGQLTTIKNVSNNSLIKNYYEGDVALLSYQEKHSQKPYIGGYFSGSGLGNEEVVLNPVPVPPDWTFSLFRDRKVDRYNSGFIDKKLWCDGHNHWNITTSGMDMSSFDNNFDSILVSNIGSVPGEGEEDERQDVIIVAGDVSGVPFFKCYDIDTGELLWTHTYSLVSAYNPKPPTGVALEHTNISLEEKDYFMFQSEWHNEKTSTLSYVDFNGTQTYDVNDYEFGILGIRIRISDGENPQSAKFSTSKLVRGGVKTFTSGSKTQELVEEFPFYEFTLSESLNLKQVAIHAYDINGRTSVDIYLEKYDEEAEDWVKILNFTNISNTGEYPAFINVKESLNYSGTEKRFRWGITVDGIPPVTVGYPYIKFYYGQLTETDEVEDFEYFVGRYKADTWYSGNPVTNYSYTQYGSAYQMANKSLSNLTYPAWKSDLFLIDYIDMGVDKPAGIFIKNLLNEEEEIIGQKKILFNGTDEIEDDDSENWNNEISGFEESGIKKICAIIDNKLRVYTGVTLEYEKLLPGNCEFGISVAKKTTVRVPPETDIIEFVFVGCTDTGILFFEPKTPTETLISWEISIGKIPAFPIIVTLDADDDSPAYFNIIVPYSKGLVCYDDSGKLLWTRTFSENIVAPISVTSRGYLAVKTQTKLFVIKK